MMASGIDIIPKVCAKVCDACGKSGDDDLKACTKCEQVYYCNNKCRKAHLQKHKKECRRYTAEMHNSINNDNELIDALTEKLSKVVISDDELFQDPPPKVDCPICFQPMPFSSGVCGVDTTYQPCCGKTLCTGCDLVSLNEMSKGNLKRCCAFCRVSTKMSEKEQLNKLKIRMEQNDREGYAFLGGVYRDGKLKVPKDQKKALELWHRAAELGSSSAHCDIATAYRYGLGIEKNTKKAIHHLKLAAIGGNEVARHNLGLCDYDTGNIDRAMKHFMIAAKNGEEDSLKKVGEGYKKGHITKDEYASTLRAYQQIVDQMKSDSREKAKTYIDSCYKEAQENK